MHVCRFIFVCMCVVYVRSIGPPLLSYVCIVSDHTLILKRHGTLSLYLNFWLDEPTLDRVEAEGESSLSAMISISGLDEPLRDESTTPTWRAIRQCRPQYPEPYVGSRPSYAEAKTALPQRRNIFIIIHKEDPPVSSHTMGVQVDFHTKWFVPVAIFCGWVLSCWQVGTMNHVTTWEQSGTAKFFCVLSTGFLARFSDVEYATYSSSVSYR